MPAASSRYDVCPPAPSSVSSYSSGISPPPSYRSQEGSILSISSSLPSYHSLPPAGHTSGGGVVVVAPPSIISPPPSYTSQVGSITPSIISQPPSYTSQVGSVTPSVTSFASPSYFPLPPMAYSAIRNFQPNLGMVPEMGMHYGVQSAPLPIPQMPHYYSIPSFQQVVQYPMQQNYQPPISMQVYQSPMQAYQPPMQMPMYQTPMPTYQLPMQMQMYQPLVMPPMVHVPGGYAIVEATDVNGVYSYSPSDPTGRRIRISACCTQ
jgi:hypothetical protein